MDGIALTKNILESLEKELDQIKPAGNNTDPVRDILRQIIGKLIEDPNITAIIREIRNKSKIYETKLEQLSKIQLKVLKDLEIPDPYITRWKNEIRMFPSGFFLKFPEDIVNNPKIKSKIYKNITPEEQKMIKKIKQKHPQSKLHEQRIIRDRFFSLCQNEPGCGDIIQLLEKGEYTFYSTKAGKSFSQALKELETYVFPWKSELVQDVSGSNIIKDLRMVLATVKNILYRRKYLEYWIDQYVNRSNWFGLTFVNEVRFTSPPQSTKSITENFLTQHLMQYLYDKEIKFTYNEHKQGFRPDVELYGCNIEVKLIDEKDTISIINKKIDIAKKELITQSSANWDARKLILLYNCSKKFKLDNDQKMDVKIVDLAYGLWGIVPSSDQRTLHIIQ
jgi:hypothetical protein